VTAFIVHILPDGTIRAELDPMKWGGLGIQRPPGIQDVLAACGVLGAVFSAEVALQSQMRMAAKIQQQQEAARIQAAIQNGADPFAGINVRR
jgi:hypothetical protein